MKVAQLYLFVPKPVTPIERLAAKLQDYLCLPDPSTLYVLMGAVAANMIEGPPVWLMLVGPPSCGKSVLLNSLLTVPRMVEVCEIATEAAFLSGTPARDRSTDATGGLLREVGDHGGLILNDFTSVLCKAPDKMALIMGVFRETFSGRWTRHIGGEGGRKINWTGKLALFAGCTGTIDHHHQLSAELGERWVYWRFPEKEHYYSESVMAMNNGGRAGWEEEMRESIREFLEEVNLSFASPTPKRALELSELSSIHNIASVAVRCRSGVRRDSYSKEIIGAKEGELEVRLSGVLSQFLIGMDHIGVPAAMRWRLLGKIALDSMPKTRKLIVETVAVTPCTAEELQLVVKCSLSVVKRIVEDLQVHDVVTRKDGKIHLTEWMTEHYRRFM